jgi:hypothetical protein
MRECRGAALSDFASQNAVLEKRLPEPLDFLKWLVERITRLTDYSRQLTIRVG